MLKLINVVNTALNTVSKVKGQLIYHDSVGQFYADIDKNGTVNRVAVRDSAAGKALEFNTSTKDLKLKNQNGSVISTVNIPYALPGDFHVSNGHLYLDD
jgi:hypothetical protein